MDAETAAPLAEAAVFFCGMSALGQNRLFGPTSSQVRSTFDNGSGRWMSETGGEAEVIFCRPDSRF